MEIISHPMYRCEVIIYLWGFLRAISDEMPLLTIQVNMD